MVTNSVNTFNKYLHIELSSDSLTSCITKVLSVSLFTIHVNLNISRPYYEQTSNADKYVLNLPNSFVFNGVMHE